MEKILIFTTRQLCYNSAAFFAARLSDAFEDLGYECELCELNDYGSDQTFAGKSDGNDVCLDEESCEKLEKYIGKHFLAVIDFNSKLPRMIMDDESFYLDHIDAPFFNYFLDHPLYHYNSLSCKLHNYNVICVDRDHCRYVKKYYPYIKKCEFVPLGASEAFTSKGDRTGKGEESVMFIGTYRDPGQYFERMRLDTQKGMDVADYMIGNPSVTIEDAATKFIYENSDTSGDDFLKIMNGLYIVDMYLRNFYREKTIDALITHHIPVRLVGDWWDRYGKIDSPYISWEKPVTYARSYDKIKSVPVLINSSPFFKNGIHDRVFAAMANKTIALTEKNAYINDYNMKAESDFGCSVIKTYDLNDLSTVAYQAEELLLNKPERDRITQAAYECFCKHNTWKCTAKRILNVIYEKNGHGGEPDEQKENTVF